MISKKKILLILVLAFSFLTNVAQETIQTDRPDQTEGVFIIKKNSFQIETGAMLTKNHRTSSTLLAPNTLFKYGLHKKLEAQLAFDVQQQGNQTGILPLSLGFKANLLKERNFIPEISLIARLQIKGLGSAAYAIQESSPLFIFAFKNSVSNRFSIEYNLGMQWNHEPKPSYAFSVSNGFDVTENFSIYLEAFNTAKENDFFNAGLDFGGMLTINKNWIIDGGFGKYIDDDDQNYFVTLGFTTRLFAGK